MTRIEIGDGTVGQVRLGGREPLVWISGPHVVEGQSLMGEAAGRLKKLSEKLGVPVVFRASYATDDPGSEASYHGPGLDEGLRLLDWVRREFELPVLSDVHSVQDVSAAADVLDAIQIPATLCQRTSLVIAAARTGKPIHIEKGPFLSPEGVAGPVGRIERAGNRAIVLIDGGTRFGYDDLVADMTAIPAMQKLGYPVLFDAGHELRREMIPLLVRAGVASGANGVVIETHPDPGGARCEASGRDPYPIDRLEDLMLQARDLSDLVRAEGLV